MSTEEGVIAVGYHLSWAQAVGWSFFIYPLWASLFCGSLLLLTDRRSRQDGTAFFVTILAVIVTFAAVLWSLTLAGLHGTIL